MDLVFQHLELVEKDYFGLQYLETRSQYNSKFLNNHLIHLKPFHLNNNNSSNLTSNQNEQKSWKWLENEKLIKTPA